MDITKLSDEELVALAKNKEAGAFSELAERYKNIIKTIVRPYYSLDGKEDLIQEGMIALYKALESFNGTSEFKSYAYRCIKNAVISAIRRNNKGDNRLIDWFISLTGESASEDADKNLLLKDVAESPETLFINEEAETEFMAKLEDKLSELEYGIVSLYLEGYSYREISDKTSKTEKSIDNALQRIKKKVAKLYEKV